MKKIQTDFSFNYCIRKIFPDSRKGSSAVLMTMIFVAVSAAVGIIYEASAGLAAENMIQVSFENAGRTVLSCYDKELQEKYGIFALEMNVSDIESNLGSIMSESLKDAPMKKCSLESVNAENASFSLINPDILKSQIISVMKIRIAEDIISDASGLIHEAGSILGSRESIEESIINGEMSINRAEREQSEKSEAENSQDSETEKVDFSTIRRIHGNLKKLTTDAAETVEKDYEGMGRTLRSNRIKNALPSASAGIHPSMNINGKEILSYFTSGKEGLGSIKDRYLVAEYIDLYFSDYQKESSGFFENEAEYIISGTMSDSENYKKVRDAIFAIRVTSNMAFLYTDSQKRNETMALAESLTPGPFGYVTQLLIITAWSSVEAVNDMRNLKAGNGVPLIKSPDTWMIDMSALESGNIDDGYVRIAGNSIMKYSEYLKLMIMAEDENTVLFRIMDLIQINMKGDIREEFTIADHFCGFKAGAYVRKRSSCPYIPGRILSTVQQHSYIDSE